MSLQKQLWFWSGAFFLLIGFIWLFNDILLPFVLGAAIAYLLEPITRFLAAKGMPRWLAGLFLLVLFFSLVIAVFALILPLAYRELSGLADAAPGYIDRFWAALAPYSDWLQKHISNNGGLAAYQDTLKDNIGRALSVGGDVLTKLISGGQALADLMLVAVITPIISFFMIKEWPQLLSWFDDQLPRYSRDTIRRLVGQIDKKIAGFVRGQITVALTLGIIYAQILFFAGLHFGFLIGLMAGVLSIIPLLGSTIGLLTGAIVAWMQSGDPGFIIMIAAVFLAGQFIEGHILTPKLLGESVGMHTLWIMFALLAGGSLFGIVGMLLAVPVAASLGVLSGFALEEYRKSPYYDQAPKIKKTAQKTKQAT